MTDQEETIMPIQPIKDNRFVQNRIVNAILEVSQLDLNDIAGMDFTEQERMQFAQLIGYSLGGFSGLSYVNNVTYHAACEMASGATEEQSRTKALRNHIMDICEGLKIAAAAAFEIHPDDLGG